jgi:hypothetical protein
MGFLDDAIREHLDLKRRRGGDPAEIERAEREALGPVRRDPFEHAEDEPELAGGEAGAYDQAAEPFDEEYEPGGDDWGGAFDDEPAAPGRESEPIVWEREPLPAQPPVHEEPFDEEPFEDEPAPAAPHLEDVGVGDETVEYDVERTFEDERAHAPHEDERAHAPHEAHPPHEDPLPPAHDEAPEDEDVLEETPEFLQDAPEHDRLWFEQRPPRDFDFDG